MGNSEKQSGFRIEINGISDELQAKLKARIMSAIEEELPDVAGQCAADFGETGGPGGCTIRWTPWDPERGCFPTNGFE